MNRLLLRSPLRQPLELDVDPEALPEAVPRLRLVRVVQVLPPERQDKGLAVPLAVLEEGGVEPEVEGALLVPLGHRPRARLEEDPHVALQRGAVAEAADHEDVPLGVVADLAVAAEAEVRAEDGVGAALAHREPEVVEGLPGVGEDAGLDEPDADHGAGA